MQKRKYYGITQYLGKSYRKILWFVFLKQKPTEA